MGPLEVSDSTWQFAFVCCAVLTIIGAVIDGWKLKVPNWLTFPMILGAWLFWGTHGWAALGQSVMGTFLALSLLLIPFLIGGMGGGDVKLYAGFGAWIVPIPWFGVSHLLWAFVISVFIGAFMGIAIALWSGSVAVNIANAKDIVRDWYTSGSVEEIAQRAKERKPRLQLIPYGVPLTIGSLAYALYVFFHGQGGL